MWLAGLSVTSMQTLELLQEEWFTKPGLMPELSFYQCHACHHPMSDLRWSPEPDGLPPGIVRLNDGSILVLAAVLDILAAGGGGDIRDGLRQLHRASLQDRGKVGQAAAQLRSRIAPQLERLAKASYDRPKISQLRRGLLQAAADGRFRHFTAAEQVFMAVETLSLELGDAERLKTPLDQWFATVEEDDPFVPQQFSVRARKMLDAL